jgi:excisionase family DNA binding protein
MLTVKDVCSRLNVSTRTVYRLIKSGKLSAKRIAGQWRFEQRDVDRLLIYKTPSKYVVKPDLMTLNEVCEYLGLSRFTIYRLVKDKKLFAVKSGGRWRFSKDDIKRFLTRNRNVPSHVLGMNFEGGVMSLSEVSKSLGVNRRTIYRLIKDGKLPATKIAGVWRFIRTEISRYMLDRKYRYGTAGVKGIFFWSQVLDKYYKKKDVYYINDSAYDGYVGNRQDYHDYKTLSSIGAVMEGDRFFTELHYRKVAVKGGYILTITYEQYMNLPKEEYMHWSGFRVPDNQLRHLQL